MRKTPAVDLSLAVQYGCPVTQLLRPYLRRRVQRALDLAASRTDLTKAVITLRLVDSTEGRELNHTYRHRDYATNVLTFAYGITPDGKVEADIVLCHDVVQREAEEQGKPFSHHVTHLLVHGLLHALGYDHETDDEAEEMEALERNILQAMNIPDPYQTGFKAPDDAP